MADVTSSKARFKSVMAMPKSLDGSLMVQIKCLGVFIGFLPTHLMG
jgi:hypothetical protein